MEEKLRFVFNYERDEQTMTELCAGYGIARETGYVWLRRYRALGVAGLVELNRAPQRHPNQTPPRMEEAVLELRQAHMRWGPRKWKQVLERDERGRKWPAASTMGELLKREGLVVPRKKRRKTAPYREPLAHADAANRVWCADFKGWFRTADGTRIDPLTISDAHSRYLLRCQAVEKTDTARIRAIFEAAFREYGMPEAIRTDNGENEWACCPSMSVGTRSTSHTFPWRSSIAGNGALCLCRKEPTSTRMRQGKRISPLPLHPIP